MSKALRKQGFRFVGSTICYAFMQATGMVNDHLATCFRSKEPLMHNTEEIWRLVDAKQDEFIALSDRVWEMPELCYGEFKSCAEHTAMLEAQGFRVTRERRRHPDRGDGRGGRRRPGHRHPGRV